MAEDLVLHLAGVALLLLQEGPRERQRVEVCPASFEGYSAASGCLLGGTLLSQRRYSNARCC